MDDVEQPVIRLIPSVSLSEESLETLVTLVEERAGVGESLLLQFRVDGSLGRPSVLLQYDTAPQTDAVRAAALATPAFSIRDDDVSGAIVPKDVTVAWVVVGSSEESDELNPSDGSGASAPREASTLLLVREWGMITLKGEKYAEHLCAIAELARAGLAEATGVDVALRDLAATPQQSRRGKARKSVSVLFVYFRGKVSPPPNGCMHSGVGVLRPDGTREVERSVEPLSFAPKRGARRHAELNMPGWAWSRREERMMTLDELASAPRGNPQRGHGGSASGRDPAAARHVPMSMQAFWDMKMAKLPPDDKAKCERVRDEARVNFNGFEPCPFWVVAYARDEPSPWCERVGRGCSHEARGGRPFEPCWTHFRQQQPASGAASSSALPSAEVPPLPAGGPLVAAAGAASSLAAVPLPPAGGPLPDPYGMMTPLPGPAVMPPPPAPSAAMLPPPAPSAAMPPPPTPSENAEWSALVEEVRRAQRGLLRLQFVALDGGQLDAVVVTTVASATDGLAGFPHATRMERGRALLAETRAQCSASRLGRGGSRSDSERERSVSAGATPRDGDDDERRRDRQGA